MGWDSLHETLEWNQLFTSVTYTPKQKTFYDVRSWAQYNLNCKKIKGNKRNIVIKPTIFSIIGKKNNHLSVSDEAEKWQPSGQWIIPEIW